MKCRQYGRRRLDYSSRERDHISSLGRAHWKSRLLVPFASLEDRNFRMLRLGQLGSALAMWADQMARSWLTWQLTGSATAIGLVNVFRAIPLITLGLLGGVMADRFDKRKILVVIQLWSLAIHVTMAVIFRAANNTTLLEITPSRLQGRIVSLTFLDMGIQSMAAIVAGRVTDIWDVSVALAVLGGMCIAIVALIGLVAPAVRRL